MPSGSGSIVALSCHMVCGMEGIGTRLPGASGGEAWGSTLEIKTNVAHEGRFAGVIRDKPTPDAAGGGGIGGRYTDVGGR